MPDLDTYDVERMIRDAVIRLRSDIDVELRAIRDDLGAERVDRQDAIESLGRVLDSRTEGLV